MTLRVISYGGGWQSNALLVLAAQGLIDYQTFLFCNVGDDSENPKTITYVNEVAKPYALKHGLTFIELQKRRRDGTPDTIYQRLTRPGSRSIGIPVRMNGSGAPGRRSCTYDFKVAVVDKWLKEHTEVQARKALRDEMLLYAESPEHVSRILTWTALREPVAHVGLGISLDEMERVKPNVDPDTVAWKENVFPLLQEVPRPLTRVDCGNIITRAGLPLPPKSACIFCPFHTLTRWQEMRKQEPEQFWYAADLEAFVNQRRKALGLDPVWFSRALKPLAQATTDYKQASLFEAMELPCDSGHCFV